MARGDRREEIFRDERDRWKFLGYLAEGAERYRVKVHCYVLMENHFHLIVMTPEGNLSQWMHQLKTACTVYFNRRHQVVGHLFQGRFKSTVIEAGKIFDGSEAISASQSGAWKGARPGNAKRQSIVRREKADFGPITLDSLEPAQFLLLCLLASGYDPKE